LYLPSGSKGFSTWFSVFATEQTPQKKQILDKIQPLQEQIVSLKNAIKKVSQFNAKARLNMEAKQIERLKSNL